ncbi:MAG: hypothetical protein ACYC2T_06180 [Bacillota bacterium]
MNKRKDKKQFELAGNWREMTCLFPVYDSYGGNDTEVWLAGGEKIVLTRKVKSVLRGLARHFAVDLVSLRLKYGEAVGRAYSVPLPLHNDLVLVPVKVREPFAKDQGAWGYLVLNKVLEVTAGEGGNGSLVTFADRSVFSCLVNQDSLRKLLNDARVVEAACRQHQGPAKGQGETYAGGNPFTWPMVLCVRPCRGCCRDGESGC